MFSITTDSFGEVELFYLAAAATPVLLYLYFSSSRLYSGLPTVGIGASWSFGSLEKAQKQWLEDASGVIRQGLKQFPGCFQVTTTSGPKIVLPGKFADEIRNNPHLHFDEAIHKASCNRTFRLFAQNGTTITLYRDCHADSKQEFFGSYPGFEIFANDHTNSLAPEMVRGRLTQSLNYITPDLQDETAAAVSEHFGESTKAWKKCQFKPLMLQLVARVSSRVFVGPELCANKDWLDLTVNITIYSFLAAVALGRWPIFLRPLVHRFIPEIRKVKQEISRARQILKPVIEKRRQQNGPDHATGVTVSKTADAIGWFDQVAKGTPYDEVQAQLGLSLAAIHTTSELTTGIIGDLCDHPEWIKPLREDMSAAIEAHGWSKKALQEMRLTDSLMKESQRRHFASFAGMQRVASEPVQLSDGTRIPKGAETIVALDMMEDESIFPDPSSYKPRRFLEKRQQPGQENKWQFVTTSPEHLAFGHGMHSCPGRFFASNEIKVILICLITKYDWKWAIDGRKGEASGGLLKSTNPSAMVMIKKRDEKVTVGRDGIE